MCPIGVQNAKRKQQTNKRSNQTVHSGNLRSQKEIFKTKSKSCFFYRKFPQQGDPTGWSCSQFGAWSLKLGVSSYMLHAMLYAMCCRRWASAVTSCFVASASAVSVSLAGNVSVSLTLTLLLPRSRSFGLALATALALALAARFCRCYDTNINRWKLLLRFFVFLSPSQ